METFKKPFFATSFVLFTILCDLSLATNNEKSTYIVHAAKSKMPESLNHHSIWYTSIMNSISNSTEMLYTYDNAVHGFSARLTLEEVQLLKSQTGILKVLPEKIYKPLTTRTPHFLGLNKIDNMFPKSKAAASDIIIGLLDTGVWPESKSFDDTGLGPIPSSWKGKCESGENFTTSNCNKKLIGARFFLKGYEASMGPLNRTKQFRSPRDVDGHGTHTASTAAGSKVEGASLFGSAYGTARGMAPRARIAIYKVCWDDTCTASDILAAMDAAISDNVNVISASLGGGPTNYDEENIAIGAFAAIEKGIVVACAAGNGGPNSSSLQNVAPWMITVGAGTLDRDFPAYVKLGNGQNYSGVSIYDGNFAPDTWVPFVYAGNASAKIGAELCEKDSLDPKMVKGKIVLCQRGKSSRIEKGLVVKSAGGVGMVLANPESDGEELVADAHLLPATIVGFKAGKQMKLYLQHARKPTATFVFEGTKVGIKPSPVVAAFSSRGPNLITPEILKPDFIAPGVSILAAYTKFASPTNLDQDHRRVDYNIISGTSMACPHASGIIALIKSIRPNWSPAAIRSALMTTAYTSYNNGHKLIDSATGASATPFEVGAGHVNPIAALNPGLVYDLAPNDYLNFLCALNYTPDRIKVVARRKFKCGGARKYVTDLNYPSFGVVFKPIRGGFNTNTVIHKRTLTNVGAAGTYKVSLMLNIPFVKVMVKPNVLSFNENEKKLYTVEFTISNPPPPSGFGFGSLEWSNGQNVVRSPISITWK